MAGHPLRSATDRRFGGPLPRQLPNQTRVHPIPPELFTPYHAVLCAYAALAVISHCYSPVWGRLPTRYSPVRHSLRTGVLRSFDLHVLSTPPAFILSQDQTLVKKSDRSDKRYGLSFPFLPFRLLFFKCFQRIFRKSIFFRRFL